MRFSPKFVPKPRANPSNEGPQAVMPEFADHDDAAGPQHTRHFTDCGCGVGHEAQNGDGHDHVERRRGEWKRPGPPFTPLDGHFHVYRDLSRPGTRLCI